MIGRMIDVPRVSRVLAESHLGSLFSHLGLRGRAVPTGAEGERGGASIGSQTFVLTSSMSNTANLLTSSDRGTHFAGRVKQNPPPGRSQLPLLLLYLSRPLNLRSILSIALRLTSGHLDGGDSPLRDDWALRINNILAEVQGTSSGQYRRSGSQGNGGRSGLRKAEHRERGRPGKGRARRGHSR